MDKTASGKNLFIIKIVIIILVGSAILACIEKEKSVEVIKVEVSSEENYEVSYFEGAMLGRNYWQVTVETLGGNVKVSELEELNDYIEIALEDPSERNIKAAYIYSATLLHQKLSFQYHEGIDKEAYTMGCMHMSSMNMMWIMKMRGEFSKDKFLEFIDKQIELLSDPTKEKIEEFEKELSEVLDEILELKEAGNSPPPLI